MNMPPETNIEKRLQDLGQAIGRDDFLRQAVMARIRTQPASSSQKNRKPGIQLVVRRLIMNRFVRLGAAAVLILALIGGVRTIGQLPKPYTIEQTTEALRNVRYLHAVKQDKAGNLEDERWEEIDADGHQARYRQNSPSISFYVVDDLKTCMVHEASKDKNTVILYDHKDQSYTWFAAPGKFFAPTADGKPKYTIVAENVQYKGRPAHHLRRIGLDTDVYIDAKTKLPLAIGDHECSFEEPPEGTFDIVIPQGVIVVDKRPGATPGPEPQWMLQEREKEQAGETAQKYFEQGRRALAACDYAVAVEALTKCIETGGPRTWTFFWLGVALCDSGNYDEAVYRLTQAIDLVGKYHAVGIPSYYLARAAAYQGKGMVDMAQIDFAKALPKMIASLRSVQAAWSFDLADDPLRRADGMKASDCHEAPTPERSLITMVNRLRLFTGQNFGFDPNGSAEDKEQAIAAWEQWFQAGGEMRFTPEAQFLSLPALPKPKPQSVIDKEEQEGRLVEAYYEDGRRALAAKNYPKAIDLLTKVVEISPRRNQAAYWLGTAFYATGAYDQAIYRLTAVIDMLAEIGWTKPPYHLTRGMAYQAKGQVDLARSDFQEALPKMIEGLRNSRTAGQFDFADDPLIIGDGMREGCHPGPTREQSVALMVNRLRLIAGQNFGYDPNGSAKDREQAIAAWEQWFQNGGQVLFTPDAKLIPVPAPAPAK
jgi:tetratricopeptide (TPR) repeat protein